MNDSGFYYLHTNGDLIWKKLRPEDDSPFVRRIWRCTFDRGCAWLIVIEALAMGADRKRIDELALKWNLTDEDAQEFVKHATSDGVEQFKLFIDGNKWCAAFHDFVDIQESQCGFGSTALEALAELAKPGLAKP